MHEQARGVCMFIIILCIMSWFSTIHAFRVRFLGFWIIIVCIGNQECVGYLHLMVLGSCQFEFLTYLGIFELI